MILQFRHLLDRQSGFQQVLGLERPDVELVLTRPYGTRHEDAAEIIRDLSGVGPGLAGIYLAGGGQPHLIERMTAEGGIAPVIIGHEAAQTFYDAEDNAAKQLRIDPVRVTREAESWIPRELVFTDATGQSVTTLRIDEVEVDIPLAPSLLTVPAMAGVNGR